MVHYRRVHIFSKSLSSSIVFCSKGVKYLAVQRISCAILPSPFLISLEAPFSSKIYINKSLMDKSSFTKCTFAIETRPRSDAICNGVHPSLV